MIDPELQHYLSGINQNLVDIKNKKPAGIWRSFFNGIFSAIGYAVGLGIVIVLLGWVLQRLGYLDSFRQQAKDIRDIINQVKDFRQPFSETGESTIVLPDGREVKVKQQQQP